MLDTMTTNFLLKPKEACVILRVHRNTLRAMIDRGQIEAVNISHGKRPTWRILAHSLQNLGTLQKNAIVLDIERRLGL
jgi:excisionase family DNA binding protein